MNFQDLKYWREKTNHYSPETRLSVNGEYCAAVDNETFITLDPTGQRPLAKAARGKKTDVDHAIAVVHTVFGRGDWSQASPAERKAVLHRLADLMGQHHKELVLLETLGTGKSVRHGLRNDIPDTAHAIRWYAEAIDKVYGEVATTPVNDLALIVREPVGVIAAIIPWDFPLLLACWKLGPILAAGNSVILKPSEESPLAAVRLAALAKKAGLPDGVLNVASRYSHEAGQALSRHPDIDVITFIGSTRTSKQLLKGTGDSGMKRVWLKARGKSTSIVFTDRPNLPKAATNAAASIFYSQGQICIVGTRLLLEESIADEFIALLRGQAKNWQPGNPLDPEITMGTLIGNMHADTIDTFIRDGEAQGTLALGGRSHIHLAAIGPMIFADTAPQAHVSRDEISSPVLVVTRFSSEAEALTLASDGDYGLGAVVWTRDLLRAHHMSRHLKAGSVFVNNYNGGDMTVPFGGYKQSGNGRDKSLHMLERFSELKAIWISLESQS